MSANPVRSVERPDPVCRFILESPLGPLRLYCRASVLARIDFDARRSPDDCDPPPMASAIGRELSAYFEDAAYRPRLALAARGTAFQQRVWQALCALSPGETISYGDLAGRLGSGARAVANACRANPLPIVVPCHRVIAARGPGGYAGQREGSMLARKLWLLAHERGVPIA